MIQRIRTDAGTDASLIEEHATLSGIHTWYHVLLLNASEGLFASQALMLDRCAFMTMDVPT
jgi:hypothetical protein